MGKIKIYVFFVGLLGAIPAFAVDPISTGFFLAQHLGIGIAMWQATVVAFVANYAISTIVNRAFSKKPPKLQDNGVRQQIPPSSTNSIPIVYGDAWLGGTFVDAVLTTDQKTMWYVVAISNISPNGQFTFDKSEFYYGDRLITFDATDKAKVASLTDGAGNVDTKIDGNLWIYLYRSTSAGVITNLDNGGTSPASGLPNTLMTTANGIPSGLEWPASGRQMNGLAFALIKLVYSQEDDAVQLQQVTFKCKHALNGSGVAKPGDVWQDYITNQIYGGAISSSLVDADSATALNTYSDELITFTNNNGIPSTQPRYRINGVLDTGETALENLDKILMAADSWMAYNAPTGKWSIVINKAETSSLTFNDSNIIGDIKVGTVDINQAINQIEARFPSKLNKDIPDYVFIKTPPLLLYPNEPVNKYNISLDLVNDSVQAQYLCNRILEQAREDLIVSIRTTYAGIQINAGDVVSITNSAYGWTNKLFRVMKVNETSLPDGSLGASLELNEYNAQVYDDKPITEFQPSPNTDFPSPTYFSNLPAPTFENITPAATIPEFTIRCTLPSTGRVVQVDLYYQIAVNSGALVDTGWIYYTSQQLATGAAYPNTGYVDFLLTGVPASPIGQQYFAGYVVKNDLGQSTISAPSTGLVWSPNIIVPSALGTNYEWSPTAVPVPTDSTGTVVTTGQEISVYLRVGPAIIDVWDGTGTQPNNSWYITSASTTTGLTLTGPVVDLAGDKFTGTVTGLTVEQAYLTVTGSYKDSSGTVTNIGSTSVAIYQQKQGSNAPVLNAEWDPTNLFQKGPDGIWYPTPVSNVISTQANLFAEVNGVQIGRYAYVITYNVNTKAWSYSGGTNPGGNLNTAFFSLTNIAAADNGYTAQVIYNSGSNVIVNNITVSASESGISALVLYKDWDPTNIFTQAANAGAWSPTPVSNVITTQCNLTAQRGGIDVGRTAVIAQYNISSFTWSFNTSGTHPDGNLNVANFSYINTQNTTNGYVSTAQYSDSIGTTTTAISISAIPSGSPGTNGTRTAVLQMFRASSTVPTTYPSGTSVYTWATATFTAPATLNGWSIARPSVAAGQTLYGIQVTYADSLTTATSTVTWNSTSPYVVGYAGTNGSNGADGSTGPRSASGFVYYSLSSASAPAAPTLSNFNFTNGTFGTITANWSTTFTAPAPSTNPSTEAGSKFWAVRYAVSESTFGGTQTVTVSTVFNWTNLDGLVTFTNTKSPSGTTFIDGGNIKADTISANTIKSNTTTPQSAAYNYTAFGLGTSSSFNSIATGAQFISNNNGYFSMIAANTGGGNVAGFGTTGTSGSTASVVGVGYANSTFTTWRTQGNLGSGVEAGYFANGGANNIQSGIAAEIRLAYYTGGTAYAFYITSGASFPFTGGHDGLQLLTENVPEQGDLMVDMQLIFAPNINDAITQMSVSTSANQPGVSGVFVGVPGSEFVPAALGEYVPPQPGQSTGTTKFKPQFANIYDTYRPLAVNALGEGKINVCGQNGNIAIGDLIVASDMPGKGMKQADDLVHSYTVAKSRENVTFSSPTEVKMIACIYMCG